MSTSSAHQTPFFETFFSKNKKIFLFLPLVIVGLLLGLYFTSNNSNANTKDSNETNVDVSLPKDDTKPLADNKIDAIDDFEQLSNAQREEISKSNEVVIDDISTETKTTSTSYQNPDEATIKKIDKMMGEMNNPKKQRTNSGYYNGGESSRTNYRTTETPPNETTNDTKESFDDFFNPPSSSGTSKRNNSSSSNSTTSSNQDNFAYVVIKGDQIGLKNNSRVTLQFPKDATIDGYTFKKNTLFYAQIVFGNNNRVFFNINTINQKPVNVKAYDAEDGGLGLQVKQSLSAETSKEMVQDAADDVDVSGIPLGNTIKRVFRRKQQEIKVDLLNNQKIILR